MSTGSGAGLDQSRVLAIDGPGGAGKSTVARALAARLGLAHLDTGAMYRAVTWAVLRDGIDPADATGAAALAGRVELDMGERVLVDGVDVSAGIRGPEVTRAVSTVSAHPAVRAELVGRQRAWVRDHGGSVVEGRDIGTVVFPGARLKIFLTASDEVRARRRAADMTVPAGRGGIEGPSVSEVAAELARRDVLDSTRAASPMSVADDAVVVDTTERGVDDIVESLVVMWEA